MFSKYVPLFFVAGLFFYISGCDEVTTPTNEFEESPIVNSLSVTPNDIDFAPSDGFKDTTITIIIDASIENISQESTFGFVLRDKISQESILNGELIASTEADKFGNEIELETTTTSFQEFLVEVYAYNNDGSGNFIQTAISVKGFSNNPPDIISVNNPDTLQRPTSGEIIARFTAKVTDLDAQNSLDQVLIRVINQETGEVTGSPFQMVDDGSSGDLIANDSTFTWALPVTPTDNNPNRDFNIEYYAIDLGGLVSDTVKTTFSIRE